MAYRKRASKKSAPRKSYAPRTKKRRASAPRKPQEVVIRFEGMPGSPVSRPDLQGLSLIEKPSKRAKL